MLVEGLKLLVEKLKRENYLGVLFYGLGLIPVH